MKLQTLMDRCGLKSISGDLSMEVTDVEDDSRRVREAGTLFAVRLGRDESGAVEHVMQAVESGAAAVVVERGVVLEAVEGALRGRGVAVLVPGVEVGDQTLRSQSLAQRRRGGGGGNGGGGGGQVGRVDQRLVGELAGAVHGEPWQRLRMVGITGTNGKTTTAYLVRHLMNAAGVRCGLIGTVAVDDGSGDRTATLTTPGAAELVRLLARMTRHGLGACAMEVSSHALHQGRVAALQFDVGVFTNLTGDHLDYHGSMEAYADAKAMLFHQLKPGAAAVVNADDVWAQRVAAGAGRVIETRVYPEADAPRRADSGRHAHGIEDPGGGDSTPFEARILASDATGSRVRVHGPDFRGGMEVGLPLVGRHNVSNALQAVAAVWSVGVLPDGEALQRALETLPAAPGRLERVTLDDSEDEELPTVLVDYAHTHDALENVLRAVRPTVAEGGRLIVVFGCGGDRDRTKRPRMGRVASELADEVWVTSDNPRTEEPGAIIAEIIQGMNEVVRRVDADRARAIAGAIASASPMDTVLIAGKGHEDYQEIGDGAGGKRRVRFDDRVQAAAALRAKPRM